MSSTLAYLAPWEFSPTVLVACAGALWIYGRGLRRIKTGGGETGFWRPLGFIVGVIGIYVVMQTYIDYLSQHMFWVHRAQHLVLHHLGPFLIAVAAPMEVLAAGAPRWMRAYVFRPIARNPVARAAYRFVQNPVIATILFVGLIYLWLTPSIHFDAMLSANRYKAMNWSMVIDGILFWWLILDPRPRREPGVLGHPARVVILWIVMLLQIVLGAYIALSKVELYDVYAVCGRAWPVSPIVDQQLGGLITWIPAAMMSVLGGLVVLRFWGRERSGQQTQGEPALSGSLPESS